MDRIASTQGLEFNVLAGHEAERMATLRWIAFCFNSGA